MLSPRALRRVNYHAAEAECQRRGITLGYWPGDEEFSGQLSLPLKPRSEGESSAPEPPVSSPNERHLRIVELSEGDNS